MLTAGTTLAAPPQDQPPPRDCNPATDEPLHGGLPFFDVRSDQNERPIASVQAAIDAARAKGGTARAVETDALLGRVPLLKMDTHQYYGTPFFIRSTVAFLTEAAPGADAKAVARDFVAASPALFEIDANELAIARMDRDAVSTHNGVRHMTFQQQIKGVDLFECNVFASVMADGRLINIGSTMLPRPVDDFAVAQPRLTDLDAIRFAASSAGVLYTQVVTPKGEAEGASQKRTWINTSDFRADEPIVTQLVYFAVTRDDIRTAWSVTLPVKGVGHTYDVIIDASTGELLRRQDRLLWDVTPMTFRVFNLDGVAPGSPGRNTPDGFQFPEVARTLVTINPADISGIDPDGWITTGLNETQGNNVDAHLDLDANNSPDLPRPNGGGTRTFDFSFDSALAPASWRDFATTELFYRANFYHDRLYALGFTEAFKNFQLNNFGRGGVGNDAVQADVQDGSGTNNANFGTSGTDGSSGRCQMYVFTGPNPDRDGDLDGDIVYHELSHGLSIRLHNGLSGTQSGGMGEGWGDFYGVSLSAEPTDDPDANYCTGGYTTLQLGSGFVNNYYFGIRRFPYSHDLNKYPLTYADIATLSYDTSIPANPLFIGNSASEVHNVGEIWCNMLLDCRSYLWHVYGFAGNQRMMQLVTDSMKLAPPGTPNFIQERDAILQADLAGFGGADTNTIWTAFARHGLGYSATSSGNGTSITEAYDLPQFVTFTFPDGVPTQLTPNASATFRVDMAPHDLTITPGTAMLHVFSNGGADQPLPLTLVGTNQFTATLPAGSCPTAESFYISVGTSAGDRTSPPNAPAQRYSAATPFLPSETVTATDGFEAANAGWNAVITRTPGTTGTLTGLWARAVPVGNAATTPQSAHGGQFCWVTQNGTAGEAAGAADVDNGTTTLTSPAFNLSGYADARFSYWRWFSNNGGSNPGSEILMVDVSNNDGATWTRAETVGPTSQNTGGWVQTSWTMSAVGVPTSSQVRVRFVAEDLIGAVVEAAIDDLSVAERFCPTACDSADFNCDGDTGTDGDIEAFFACIAGACPSAPCTNSADFNHDGDIGTDSDIEAFFRVLGGGAC